MTRFACDRGRHTWIGLTTTLLDGDFVHLLRCQCGFTKRVQVTATPSETVDIDDAAMSTPDIPWNEP